MAAQVAPLPQLRLPSGPAPITAEQRYWKSFRNNHRIESPTGAPITHISYNPPTTAIAAPSASSSGSVSDDVFAVTTGTRVQIYSARTCKLEKTLTRFGDVARSATVRARGGGVVAAGDDQGLLQVFDLGSRAILRTWTAHKPQPVWAVRWSPASATTLLSAGDDRTVRLWDLPANEPVVTLRGHADYVRAAAFVPPGSRAGEHVFVTGSYDATVRLWDSRAPASVMAFKHAAPVEDVLAMPSATTVLATAGNAISVLDLVAARPMALLTNHQKTVTSLSVASGGSRVVSGGLDGHVKVFETTNWNVVYGSKFDSPILAVQVIGAPDGSGGDSSSAALAPGNTDDILSDRHLLVGTQSGLLSIKTRLTGAAAVRARERKKEMAALLAGRGADLDKRRDKRKRHADARRRLDLVGEGADVIIAHDDGRRARRENPWHRDLRKGHFASALDRALDPTAPGHGGPVDVLSLLVALRHRSAMRDALEGRDETTVQPVLRWLAKHISDPRYVGVCVEAALHLFELYAEHVGGSPELNQAFRTLHRRVKGEVEKAQVACETNGMLETLILAAAD